MSIQRKMTPADTDLGGSLRSRIAAIGVVVAARNSAGTVARCILNLYAAHNTTGWRHPLWIVVVAIGCTDATADNARQVIGAFGEVIEVPATAEQSVLQIGGSVIVEHFHSKPRHAILLAHVTADRCVDTNWMAARLGRHWPN